MGTSIDLQARVLNAERAFEKVKAKIRWLSVEPMIEPLTFSNLALFDWIVIGGASPSKSMDGTPARRLEPADRVGSSTCTGRPHRRLQDYYKSNSGLSDMTRIREFPGREATAPRCLRSLTTCGTSRKKSGSGDADLRPKLRIARRVPPGCRRSVGSRASASPSTGIGRRRTALGDVTIVSIHWIFRSPRVVVLDLPRLRPG